MASTPKSAATRCEFVKPNGKRCGAQALHNSRLCYFHDQDPSLAADRNAARKKGGIERSRRAAVLPPETPDRPLNSAADISTLLADAINYALRGQLDPRILNTIGYLSGLLLRTIETTQTEQRLKRVEQILASQNIAVPSQAVEIVCDRACDEGDLDHEKQETQNQSQLLSDGGDWQ